MVDLEFDMFRELYSSLVMNKHKYGGYLGIPSMFCNGTVVWTAHIITMENNCQIKRNKIYRNFVLSMYN